MYILKRNLFLFFLDEENDESTMLDKTVYGVENSSSFLECNPKSQRALIYWQFQRHGDDRKQEVCPMCVFCVTVCMKSMKRNQKKKKMESWCYSLGMSLYLGGDQKFCIVISILLWTYADVWLVPVSKTAPLPPPPVWCTNICSLCHQQGTITKP